MTPWTTEQFAAWLAAAKAARADLQAINTEYAAQQEGKT